MVRLRLGRCFWLSFGLMLAACSGGGSPITAPTPPPATFNTGGSTNTGPFTVVIQFDGDFTVTTKAGSRTGVAPASLTSQFYTDIGANLPVSNIRTTMICAKPVSFATTTTITYEGSTSGDISCPDPNSSVATQIWSDVQALMVQFFAL